MFCHLRGQPGTCLRFGARCRSFTGKSSNWDSIFGGITQNKRVKHLHIFKHQTQSCPPSIPGTLRVLGHCILQFPRSVGAGSDHRTIGRRKTWDRVEDWSGAIENIPVECELFSDNWTYDLSINISSGVLRF